MIIQLKGMLFNNDVTFGKAIELSKETKALFGEGGYTKSLTDKQKVLLQSTIEDLQSEGIWDKIGKLYLPCLAGTNGEAFLDVKNSYGNKTNIIDVVGNGVTSTIEGNHVNIGGEITDTKISTGIDYTVEDIQDFHVGVMFENSPAVKSIIDFNTFSLESGSANGITTLQCQAISSTLKFNINSILDDYFNGFDYSYPIILGTFDNSKVGFTYGKSGSIIYKENTTPEQPSWQFSYSDIKNNKLVFFRTWESKVSKYNQIQLITVGKKLTEEENKKYSQIIHNFITSIYK